VYADVYIVNNFASLPQRIRIAAVQALTRGDSSLETAPLWLDASWRAAQREGITEGEFLKWLDLGMWNLAGNADTISMVGFYRSVAGDKGWVLARAGMTREQCLELFHAEGPQGALDAAEALIALMGLAENIDDWGAPAVDEEPAPPTVQDPTNPSGPLNFD
jgi:hypothetical protein